MELVLEPFRHSTRSTIRSSQCHSLSPLQIEIETLDNGVVVASKPISNAVTFDGAALVSAAFDAFAAGTVADMEACAATLVDASPAS
jgi:hypothetical protein